MLIKRDNIFIYFGDKQNCFNPELVKLNINNAFQKEPFVSIKAQLEVSEILFLHQVHGSEGKIFRSIDDVLRYKSFATDGDFLITSIPKIGLAVATADCLPIVLYDCKNFVISIIHAGWKGTLAGICLKAVQTMKEQYNSDAKNMQVFFGPAASDCCYEVGADFKKFIPKEFEAGFVIRGDSYYFNCSLVNYIQLLNAGIPETAFDMSQNQCTIHTTNFCSYRRDQQSPLRQMTIVALNN